jgi:hypothetical protein
LPQFIDGQLRGSVVTFQPFHFFDPVLQHQGLPIFDQIARQLGITGLASGVTIHRVKTQFRVGTRTPVMTGVDLASMHPSATDARFSLVTQPDKPVELPLCLFHPVTTGFQRILLRPDGSGLNEFLPSRFLKVALLDFD